MALLLGGGGAWAEEIDHERQYRACMALTHREPMAAFESALAWEAVGGGAPARHCAALALLEAGQHDRAAQRLEALAAELPAEYRPSPGDIMAQAANVWLLGRRPERARQAIDLALQYDPDVAHYLVDRARILAELGDHAAALADLDRAVALDPDDADAATFRASALRHLGRPTEALAAAGRALALNPDNPSAWLERGIIRQALGDVPGARADWLKTASDFGGTPAARAAQARLQALDLERR
ncbi:MAG: tetratricopeptide repeat protein [Alphaproteobacteria bacterium]|nr:tetratricopeptide repeat protein [Alphaproteobacteria bacterium]